MGGYNPSGPIPVDEPRNPYKKWYVIFTPFFDLTRGKSSLVAMLDSDKERCTWLNSEDADTYVRYFRKKVPDGVGDTIFDKVQIANRPGRYFICARQPKEG
jgi:hypothetical protein